MPSAESPDLPRLRSRVLQWFERHARPLPWRGTRDPYAIWISEVMLQQTQVAAVIPFFERFLRTFPTLGDLAAASEQDVLRHWEGLGYYRRARYLLACARKLVEVHAGVWPRDPRLAASLPGLGRYTANAILSQAFDLPLPILEANTRRVLCRLDGVRDDPRRRDVEAKLWARAESLVPRNRAGDFNQALMEIGALVCTPEAPRCDECPLREACVARRLGLQGVIPRRAAKRRPQQVRELALLVARAGRFLLVRRPDHGRWANLWEFPHHAWPTEVTASESSAALLGSLGLVAALGSERAVVRHAVTRYRIQLRCWQAAYRRGVFRSGLYAEARWVTPAQLADYPLSSPQRRLANLLMKANGGAANP